MKQTNLRKLDQYKKYIFAGKSDTKIPPSTLKVDHIFVNFTFSLFDCRVSFSLTKKNELNLKRNQSAKK